MVDLNLRRRLNVIYVLVAFLGTALVVACYPTGEQPTAGLISGDTLAQASTTPSETNVPTPSETPTSLPTLTDTPIPSPTFTVSPTPACIHLLNPPDGSRIAELGKVKFEWEPHPGAQKYLLEITAPDGHMLAFDTFNTSLERYLNTLPWEGIYTWQVAAMNSEGGVLCIADVSSFSKPKFQPSLTPERNPPPPRNPEPPNNGGG